MPRASIRKKGRAVRGRATPARNRTKNKKICLSAEGQEFLPDEIIIEILSWLPVKWILRCKCVCKLWYTMILDRKFVDKHMHRGKRESHVYDEKGNSNDGDEEAFTYLHNIHGLLLETSIKSTGKYRVRNPATKQVVELPDPEVHRQFMIFCFVPSTTDYKLICTYYKKGTTDLGVKILTIGTDLAWRPLDISLSFDITRETTFIRVGFEGFVYIVKFCEAELGKTEIIRLMSDDESFLKIKIPQGLPSGGKQFTPLVWNEKLTLGCIIREELHVLVLENYKKQKWSEKKIIPLGFMKDYPDMRLNIYQSFWSSGRRLHFTLNSEHELIYDIDSMKVQHVTTGPLGEKVLQYSMVPSLVFLPGMRPEEKINKST